MKGQVVSRISRFIKENLTFLILFLLIITVVEIICYNHDLHNGSSANSIERKYQVEDGELIDFVLDDGMLVSQSIDPNITFYPDTPVKSIAIRCFISNPESLSKIYYRAENEFFSEDKSITFHLSIPQTVVEFPQVINAESIRLDLTDRTGDVLNCQGFTINPKPSYTALTLRILFYLLILTCWVLGRKYIDPTRKEKIKTGFYRYTLLIFIVALIGIDLLYTITLTWDSGHYLWLADVIWQGSWGTWDPIRNVGFPLLIYLSQSLLGYSTTALLIPMMVAHICLFVMSYFILMGVFKPHNENTRLLIMTFLFLFIALDPTIVGYYHTLLTEYVAATIGIFSCFAAILLYKAPPFSKRFYFLTAYFLVMVPIAWHVKQPYIGAALFPFLIVCLLLLIQQFKKNTILYVFITGVSLVILVLGSTVAWNSFLRSNGNPMDEGRQLTSVVERRFENQKVSFRDDPITWGKYKIKQYLKSTNVIQIEKENLAMTNFSLTRGFQNTITAQKMFIQIGEENIEPVNKYDPYTNYLINRYIPPEWINSLFRLRLGPSNFLFTVTYLILPFYVIFQLVYWIKKKTPVNALLLILGGSSLLNALLHLLTYQIDRYLFWGYPLNLLVISLLLIQLIITLMNKLKKSKIENLDAEIPA